MRCRDDQSQGRQTPEAGQPGGEVSHRRLKSKHCERHSYSFGPAPETDEHLRLAPASSNARNLRRNHECAEKSLACPAGESPA